MLEPDNLKVKEKAKKTIKNVLLNNQGVRSELYCGHGKANYFEFEIPEIEEFNAEHYSPLVYDKIPYLERGTLAYDDFWDEQDRRCIHGYSPLIDGVQYERITGPHYFYLNMVQIMMKKVGQKGKKKLNYPYYRVLDHMLFLEIEKAEILGYGLIIGKARRMGLSYIGDCMTIWNLLFFLDNECAIGAGKKDKALELFEKVMKSLSNIREEYKVSYKKRSTPNGAELKFGYEVTENKVKKIVGVGSKLTVKTFFSDPSAFEGGSYSFFIFEEIGIQDNLIKSYKASEPCFLDGADQFGVPMMYGTGGEVDKGSRDMKIVYENPEAFNMKKLFIPAYLYYPGSDPEEVGDDASEMDLMETEANFFNPKTGRTDTIAALKHILKRRKRSSKSKDGYIKELQSRPTEEAHLFLKTSGGTLNRIILNNQLQKIYDEVVAYNPILGRLEWDYDSSLEFKLARCQTQKERDKLHILHESKVKFIEDPNGTFYKIADPINKPGLPYDADIAGTDSYDEVVPENTGSMGATLGYRVFNGLSKDYNMPVGLVYERGDASSDDTFYGNSLKFCVMYKMKTLVEYSKIMIINYFEDCNAQKYLKEKPILRNEAIANKGRQTYGVHMKAEMKNIGTRLLKQEVNNNCGNIWLDLILLDLIDYGEENTDISMAYVMILIHKLDMFDDISDDIEEYDDGDVLMDMEFYEMDASGNLNVSSYKSNNDYDAIETFDPRKHLQGEDRENYLNFMKIKKQKLEEQKQLNREVKDERTEDPFVRQVENEIEKREKNGDL
jgi:hypothetical protein